MPHSGFLYFHFQFDFNSLCSVNGFRSLCHVKVQNMPTSNQSSCQRLKHISRPYQTTTLHSRLDFLLHLFPPSVPQFHQINSTTAAQGMAGSHRAAVAQQASKGATSSGTGQHWHVPRRNRYCFLTEPN